MSKLVTKEACEAEKLIKERVSRFFTYLVNKNGGVVDKALPFLGIESSQRDKVYKWKKGESVPSPTSREALARRLNIETKDINQYFEGHISFEEITGKISRNLNRSVNQLDNLQADTFSILLNDKSDLEDYLSDLNNKPLRQIIQEIRLLAQEFDRKSAWAQAIALRLENELLNSSINGAAKSRDFDPTVLKQVIDFTLETKKITLKDIAAHLKTKEEDISLLMKGFYPPDYPSIFFDNLAESLIKSQTPVSFVNFKDWADLRDFCGL